MKIRISHTYGSSLRQLGPLEERLLGTLWKWNSATVRELCEDDYTDLAYTTVMSTLDRLFKKGLLTRAEEGRAFRYTPRFSREELHREAAGQSLRRLLVATPASSLPLSFLVEILGERDVQLVDDLRKLLKRKRREMDKHDPSRRKKR
jgi:BlaI family penicillinase repressor